MRPLLLAFVCFSLLSGCSHTHDLTQRRPSSEILTEDFNSIIQNNQNRRPLLMIFNNDLVAQKGKRRWYYFLSISDKNSRRRGSNADIVYLRAASASSQDRCTVFGDNDVANSDEWSIKKGIQYYLSQASILKEGYSYAPVNSGVRKLRMLFKSTIENRWQPGFVTLECVLDDSSPQLKNLNDISELLSQKVSFQ